MPSRSNNIATPGGRRFRGWTAVTREWPPWVRYATTVLLFALPLGLQPVWYAAAEYPFLFFLTYVIACAVLFDRGSSLLATALSACALAFFSLEPQHAFSVPGAPDAVAWCTFVAVALLTGGIIELFHKVTNELHSANAALAASEQEKDLLLRESMHRMRNDLTRLVGLITLEEKTEDDPRLREKLQRVAERVHVFSRLQNRLSQTTENSVVQMQDFLADLCRDLHSSMAGVRPIEVVAHADPRPVPEATAVVLGLITNELVTNALKHAFPDNRAGKVAVTFRSHKGECTLCVEDDGVGIPEPSVAAFGKAHSQGQRLIHSLIAQLNGAFEIRRRRDGSGTIGLVRFPA